MDTNLFYLFLGTLVFLQLQLTESVKLSNDGGYEIVVAVDENAPIPSVGTSRYLSTIKNALNVFNNRMWMSTKNRFYLKQVNLLLPKTWDVPSETTTTANYENADIRLSPQIFYPSVENPNVCGQSGKFIELPLSFFSVSNSGPYGLHWKALLHMWAQYRFGVHSEHGYVGDSMFPYAFRNPNRQLTVTGCSNANVKGKFVDLTNPDANCEAGNGVSNNCRFVPDSTGQNATSSLMHFHWIETVTEFCDEHNHNRFAPNKQNTLCDHKSVWEVIRESCDYQAVTSPRGVSIPVVKLRILRHSPTPLLYILLDKGLVQGSFPVANQIPRQLASFVLSSDLKNTVASIGAYPGPGNSAIKELVQWSTIGSNTGDFLDAIGELRADGPLQRDFSRALFAVAEEIKRKQHPNGAVVLVVKYGADIDSLGSYLPEAEVISAFNEDNIILNSIELNFPNHSTGYSHLARLARETGGSYSTVENYGEADLNVRNVLNYAKKTVLTEYTDLRRYWKTLRKEAYSVATAVPIPEDIQDSLQIFTSSLHPNLTSSNFTITGYNFTSGSQPRNLKFKFRKSLDWNNSPGRSTYSLEVARSELTGFSQVSIQVECNTGLCNANSLLARAEFTNATNQVQINVYTDVDTDEADLSDGSPISIFAKVTKNGLPVDGAIVSANLLDMQSSTKSIIPLLDDGKVSPDAHKLDGIYSAYFAPEKDGQYHLSVTVEAAPTMELFTAGRIEESAFIRLLPIGQEDAGCGSGSCKAEKIEGSFSRTVDLPTTFTVVEAELYAPVPTKILTLSATDEPNQGRLTLYWIAPLIPGRLQEKATSYELRSSTSLEQLITNFENQTRESMNLVPNNPGRNEMFSLPRPSSTRYYAIRSIYKSKPGSPSNAAEVIIQSTTPTASPPTGSTSGSNPPTNTASVSAGPTSTGMTGNPSASPSTFPTAAGSSTRAPPTGSSDNPTTSDFSPTLNTLSPSTADPSTRSPPTGTSGIPPTRTSPSSPTRPPPTGSSQITNTLPLSTGPSSPPTPTGNSGRPPTTTSGTGPTSPPGNSSRPPSSTSGPGPSQSPTSPGNSSRPTTTSNPVTNTFPTSPGPSSSPRPTGGSSGNPTSISNLTTVSSSTGSATPPNTPTPSRQTVSTTSRQPDTTTTPTTTTAPRRTTTTTPPTTETQTENTNPPPLVTSSTPVPTTPCSASQFKANFLGILTLVVMLKYTIR